MQTGAIDVWNVFVKILETIVSIILQLIKDRFHHSLVSTYSWCKLTPFEMFIHNFHTFCFNPVIVSWDVKKLRDTIMPSCHRAIRYDIFYMRWFLFLTWPFLWVHNIIIRLVVASKLLLISLSGDYCNISSVTHFFEYNTAWNYNNLFFLLPVCVIFNLWVIIFAVWSQVIFWKSRSFLCQ